MLRRALWLAAGSLGFGLALGCGAERPKGPPPAPPVASASDLIPPDLDVVVRLDLGRVKSALGGAAVATLSREALAKGGLAEDELVVASLLEADVVYLAYRPSRMLLPLDRVLALQGRFAADVKPPAGFSGVASDLGGDVRYWERRPGARFPREGVARIYAIGDRVRAFVSEAELDSMQRLLGGQGAERRLQAPEEGTLSLAARPQLLARLASGDSLRELLDGAQQLRVVVDLEADGVRFELELVLEDAESSARLVKASGALIERAAARAGLLPFTEPPVKPGHAPWLRAEGARALLSARFSRAQLAPVLACFGAASAAECPW
jgi:hypothetical protein